MAEALNTVGKSLTVSGRAMSITGAPYFQISSALNGRMDSAAALAAVYGIIFATVTPNGPAVRFSGSIASWLAED